MKQNYRFNLLILSLFKNKTKNLIGFTLKIENRININPGDIFFEYNFRVLKKEPVYI